MKTYNKMENNKARDETQLQIIVPQLQKSPIYSEMPSKNQSSSIKNPQFSEASIKDEEKLRSVDQQRAPKIPQTMISFLRQKRVVSELIDGKKQKSLSKQKSEKRSTALNQTQQTIIQNKSQQFKTPSNKIYPQSNLHLSSQNKNQQEQIICTICEGQVQKKMKKVKLFNCDHVFCYECTKNYIQYKIKMFEQIYCPNQNCKGYFDKDCKFYCDEISLKQRKQYLKIHNFLKIHKANGPKRLCPKQDCQGILNLDNNFSTIKCQVCLREYCSKCFSISHEGQCENLEAKFLRQNLNLVKCQKCKNYIQKSQGCHHISCKCGYQFCQRCKQSWSKQHICKYTGLSKPTEGWGGCDWGITTKDHIKFLLKLPLKFFLIIICTMFWTIFSFLGVPLNVVLFTYWMYLVFMRPTIQMICNQKEYTKIFVYILLFPFMMVFNVCEGKQYLITHLDGLLPEITNSFRWIIRL